MRTMLRLLMTSLATLLFGGITYAQDRNCASHEVFEAMMLSDNDFRNNQANIEAFTAEYLKRPGVQKQITQAGTILYKIPVVFHVVYRTTAENISDARVLAQLQVLNEDFQKLNSDYSNTPNVYLSRVADVQVEFCLAVQDPNGNATTGIIRKPTTKTSFNTNNAIKYSSQGGSDAWDRNQYLNIWVGNLSNGLLGYAQFPGGNAATDGVVVHYQSVGGPNVPGGYGDSYGIGRTATHEVGHWLNLRHIWGDGNCATDYVDDTPFHPSSNGGCPSATLTTSCSQNNGVLMMWMNYMDYTYDRCMYMFTTGQKARMHAVLGTGGARASLQSSQGCGGTGGGTTCTAPANLTVSNITTNAATLNWSAVNGASSYTVSYRPVGGNFTDANTSNTSYNLSSLTSNTTYEWKVSATCSSSSSSATNGPNFTTASVTSPDCTAADLANDNSTSPTSLAVGSSTSAIICSAADVDWYTFSNNNQNRYVKVTLSIPDGVNYDMALYRPNGNLAGTTSGTNKVKTIEFNGNPTGAYRVRVYSSGGFSLTNTYSLLAQISNKSIPREGDTRLIVSGATVTIAPNPLQTEMIIHFGADWKGTATVKMTDISGRNMLSRQVQAAGAARIGIGHLANGLYHVRVSNGDLSTIQKVMVLRQ